MSVVQLTKGFTSVASAKNFLSAVRLSEDPLRSRLAHPMGHLFAASMDVNLRNVAAAIVGSPPSGQKDGGGTQQASTPATPASDPTTIAGTVNIQNQLQQSFVVGSGILSFDNGVTADRKSAAISSTLLAQLLADKLNPDRTKSNFATNWYATYFNTLINIGWIVQGDSTVHHGAGGTDVTVDKEIISLATSLVGASGAAAVTAVLNSLKNLSANDPVITLFKQTSQTNSVAQFTVSLASQDATAGFLLKGMEFDLTATAVDTQVLFFNWTTTTAQFNWRNLVLSIDDEIYSQISSIVISKIKDHITSFVKEIPSV